MNFHRQTFHNKILSEFLLLFKQIQLVEVPLVRTPILCKVLKVVHIREVYNYTKLILFITDYKCSKSNIIDHMTHLKVDKDHEKLYKSYREYEEEQEEITITKTAAD